MQKKLIQLYGKLRFGLLVVTLFQGKGHAKGTQGTQADNRQRNDIIKAMNHLSRCTAFGMIILAGSPSPSLLRKSTSPKGRGFGKEVNFAWTAKGSHFGGAGIEQSEMTERARMPTLYNCSILQEVHQHGF